MMYHPKYLTANEIVQMAGFVSANRGWQFPLKDEKKMKRRLHALTHYGYIDLHKDTDYDEKNTNHSSVKKSGSIIAMMGEFRKIDIAGAPWWCRFVERIKSLIK